VYRDDQRRAVTTMSQSRVTLDLLILESSTGWRRVGSTNQYLADSVSELSNVMRVGCTIQDTRSQGASRYGASRYGEVHTFSLRRQPAAPRCSPAWCDRSCRTASANRHVPSAKGACACPGRAM